MRLAHGHCVDPQAGGGLYDALEAVESWAACRVTLEPNLAATAVYRRVRDAAV